MARRTNEETGGEMERKRQKGRARKADAGRRSNGQLPFFPRPESNRIGGLESEDTFKDPPLYLPALSAETQDNKFTPTLWR